MFQKVGTRVHPGFDLEDHLVLAVVADGGADSTPLAIDHWPEKQSCFVSHQSAFETDFPVRMPRPEVVVQGTGEVIHVCPLARQLGLKLGGAERWQRNEDDERHQVHHGHAVTLVPLHTPSVVSLAPVRVVGRHDKVAQRAELFIGLHGELLSGLRR